MIICHHYNRLSKYNIVFICFNCWVKININGVAGYVINKKIIVIIFINTGIDLWIPCLILPNINSPKPPPINLFIIFYQEIKILVYFKWIKHYFLLYY